jgi:nucleotide-binding universal stress UspA family protein
MTVGPIVAGTDGSPESLLAVDWAAREAKLRQVPLRIVAAPLTCPDLERPGKFSYSISAQFADEAAREDAARALRAAVRRTEWLVPGLRPGTAVIDGTPAQALLNVARNASMLVVGSRRARGSGGMMLGPVSRYVSTHAPLPVVIVCHDTASAHGEIVVGVEDPDRSDAVLEFGFEEAALRGARLLAVHGWPWVLSGPQPARTSVGDRLTATGSHRLPDEAATRLEATLGRWREKHPGVQAGWEVVHDNPVSVLAGASARADLLLIGRDRQGSVIGSVSYAALDHAHCPVAVIPVDPDD